MNPIIDTICEEQAKGHIVARARPLMPGRFELDFADGSARQYDLPLGTTNEKFREMWREAQSTEGLEWCGMEEEECADAEPLTIDPAPR